jgi:hypothetical protein
MPSSLMSDAEKRWVGGRSFLIDSDASGCFRTEEFWGIKTVGVRSELYSNRKGSRYRFGFASGHSV